LHLVPRYVFERLAAQHHGDAKLRTMTRWSQFVALVAAQLSGRASLRDLEASLAAQQARLYHLGARVTPRSSLSRVNAEQPYSLDEALCAKLLERCSALAPRHGFRFKHKLYTLDSSFIELSLMVFPWASYKSAKGAAKRHVALDHEGYLPAFVSLTDGQTGDIAEARRLAWPRGSRVVCDKGYTDFAWYQALIDQGVLFGTRARDNACLEVLSHAEPRHENVRFDQTVRMRGWLPAPTSVVGAERRGVKPRAIGLRALRRVGWRAPETGKESVFLTTAFHLAARTIAEVYRARRQIELFFKWLKQNLPITTFLGTSRNAVLTQIWIAMCVYLILADLKFVSRTGRSLPDILRLLHLNLFQRRDLAALLAGTVHDPVPKWQRNQMVLL
jgi:hypothetical protein